MGQAGSKSTHSGHQKADEGGLRPQQHTSDERKGREQEGQGQAPAQGQGQRQGPQERWGGGDERAQPLGLSRYQGSITDDERKKEALAQCASQHVALVECLRGRSSLLFDACGAENKAFWRCYAEHRGVEGNRVMAWISGGTHTGAKMPKSDNTPGQ